MAMKLTWNNLMRGLGAAAVAVLMLFTGLTPAGADGDSDLCIIDKGTTITWRDGICRGPSSALSLESRRYSRDTGEIMWERESGAVGYEIIRDGQSLGVHDVLSWYMTGLQENSSYGFEVRAIDQNGNYMGVTDGVLLHAFHALHTSYYQ